MSYADSYKVNLIASGRVYWTGTLAQFKASSPYDGSNPSAMQKLIEKGYAELGNGIIITLHNTLNFRAVVYRRGAEREYLYGRGLNALIKRAYRTLKEPMWKTEPVNVVVSMPTINGNYLPLYTFTLETYIEPVTN